MNTNKQPKLNMQEAMELTKRIADEEGIKLTFMKADEGRGGYNYGGSYGDGIMLAPFAKIGADGKIDGYSGEQPCDNPVECMLISFFHELSHCKLANELSAERSTMQNELWVSMTGIIYAETKYKLEFSDTAVKWLLNENFSYAKESEVQSWADATRVTGAMYAPRNAGATAMRSQRLRSTMKLGRRRPMASEIERPRNCGECRRMFRGTITVNGKRYDGGCPEFAHPVMRDWICHPNVGIKKEAK